MSDPTSLTSAEPGPHTATDTFDGAPAAVEERRTHERDGVLPALAILNIDGTELLRCTADNICEGGLHLTASPALGFAVGGRYEVRFVEPSSPDGAPLPPDGCYATVVRTRPAPGAEVVGVGLRFDHPVMLQALRL